MGGNAQERYRVAGPKVIHEAFDDEVIVGNLERGHYHSLEGTAADIWAGCLRGLSRDALVDHLAARYTGDRSVIEAETLRFLGQLQAEGLLAVCPDGNGDPAVPPPAGTTPDTTGAPFQPPVLNTYTDMEELLLLDPIHDVDASGWPAVKPDAGPRTE